MRLSLFYLLLVKTLCGCDHTPSAAQCPPHPSDIPGCVAPPREHPGEVEVDPLSQAECVPATADISPTRHVYARDNMEVDEVSFGSCHLPEYMEEVPNFWEDMRTVSHPDLWLWLGDNMYRDGSDINEKRLQYNKVKEEARYQEHGPINPESPIPIMAGWDDHDYGYNDAGNDYVCKEQSQAEWAHFTDIPPSEPQHPDSPDYRPGVYNSRMFRKPGTEENGIHVIILDNRSQRDPTFSRFGECRGSETRMLGQEQWTWLEAELERESEIKIIGSGVQVLPPTDITTRIPELYCAHDIHNKVDTKTTTFMDSLTRVGEGDQWYGVSYEMWGQVPLEREKLLGLAQRSINNGKTKAVIFVSGDPHWAEFMAKRMPASDVWGPEQILYEVTASGIPQNWPGFYLNSNRLRVRSADHQGEGPFNQNCQFPFIYKDTEYNSCTEVDSPGAAWCSTFTDLHNNHLEGYWGRCEQQDRELAQQTFSNSTNTCSNSPYHICIAKANYGYIQVDFTKRAVEMTIRTPEEDEQMTHTIKY